MVRKNAMLQNNAVGGIQLGIQVWEKDVVS